MHVNKYLTIVLTAVLMAGFLFGALARVSLAGDPANWWKPPIFKCLTEFGTSIDVEQSAGSYSCDTEGCFYVDGCWDDNVWYECCYRYKNGLCDCWCQVVEICD